MPLTLNDFDYALPAELIAQTPAAQRTSSRLLRLAHDTLSDHVFRELPQFLHAGDLMVFNDTRVIKARLYGHKESGGRIEALIERIDNEREAWAQVRANRPLRPGSRLIFADTAARVYTRREDLYLLRFEGGPGVSELLERHGHTPLPPYIKHADAAADTERYQTVYARHAGAVAAPTAGLHFDDALLAGLHACGVRLAWLTLHVGAGTFQPVRTERIAEHKMHSERYAISEATAQAVAATKAAGRAVIAVGTTSLRALESAARDGVLRAGAGETDLFVTPGYRFRVADRLITNFHLPKSTLLMLVAAFAGLDRVRAAYAHAIARRYRFFSYGDAMLVDRMTP